MVDCCREIEDSGSHGRVAAADRSTKKSMRAGNVKKFAGSWFDGDVACQRRGGKARRFHHGALITCPKRRVSQAVVEIESTALAQAIFKLTQQRGCGVTVPGDKAHLR